MNQDFSAEIFYLSPLWKKTIIFLIVFLAALFLGYWFFLKADIDFLKTAHEKENELRQQFETTQENSVSLSLYQKQLKTVNHLFKEEIKKFPAYIEIPLILEEISRAGAENGLSFHYLKPVDFQKKENDKGTDSEKLYDSFSGVPVEISATGNYLQMANFISQLANTHPIIVFQDFSIHALKPDEQLLFKNNLANEKLEMTMTAAVYGNNGKL
jgi:Tfp pilus assembly protein PilO